MEVEHVTRFEALCDALHRNDPLVDTVDVGYILVGHDIRSCFLRNYNTERGGWCETLAAALVSNINVSTIRLDLDNVTAPQSLLSFFRDSVHLHTVALGGCSFERYTHGPLNSGDILLALAENPNIVTFSANFFVPVDAFVHFLQSSQSVKNIELNMAALNGLESLVPEVRHEVVTALASVPQLEKLQLTFADPFDYNTDEPIVETEPRAILESIISSMALSPQTLRDLEIRSESNYQGHDEIPSYLRPHELTAFRHFLWNTTSLQSLKLAFMRMDKDFTELLIDGFSSNQSVTQLALFWCGIQRDAAQMLVGFIQTDANRHGNMIRELSLRDNDFLEGQDSLCSSTLLPPFLMDSALESVKLCGVKKCEQAGLFSEISKQTSHIRLSQLDLDWIELTTWNVDELASFLDTTVSLTDLRITSSIPPIYDSSQILRAVKQNSSLHSIALLMQHPKDASLFTEEEEARVQVYCTRNKKLPSLLVEALTDNSAGTAAAAAPPAAAAAEVVNHPPTLLLPSLLWVATRQTPITAPTTILCGLLSASEHVYMGVQQQQQQRSTSEDLVSCHGTQQQQQEQEAKRFKFKKQFFKPFWR